jgi:hypothetical protein
MSGDCFGWSVGIFSGHVVVGAHMEQEYKLVAGDAGDYDAFGCSVAIHENVIFVGADLSDGVVRDAGAAYIYAPETAKRYTPSPTRHPTQRPTLYPTEYVPDSLGTKVSNVIVSLIFFSNLLFF